MRLIRLGLDRFGHFTDGGIDLGVRPDFHIVCGSNEAGKTTTLRALGDLFLGGYNEPDQLERFKVLSRSKRARSGDRTQPEGRAAKKPDDPA